ncbi:hypothetical protein B0H12DRAFT_291322 [Mycena haematopus]|nr:hypothetical protein B0H12DRAFT_291322 [Mycena haematopus]
MPVLPQDLFETIIDELQDDKNTLKSCALVASSFLPPSQRNLFRKVRVGPTQDFPATFLAESPHLALRQLVIQLSSDLTTVVALRPALNIETLIVSGRAVLSWSDLGNEISSALFDSLSRPFMLYDYIC